MKSYTNKKHKQEVAVIEIDTMAQTNRDLVFSILVVSLLVNMIVLIGWIALKVTSVYDAEVAALLFTR